MTTSPSASDTETSRRYPEWLLPAGLALLLSILLVVPFFSLGTASGHDFEFHAASWMDVAYQWKEGIFYPRWTAWTNHGFGEPRFIFYPPLSWMLGAALSLLLPDAAVPILFIVLVQIFAGVSSYFLLRRFAARRAALLGAGFYAINPYVLLMSYVRSDFAEQLACALFPLLLLTALRLCGFFEDFPPKPSSIAFFSLPFAGVWLSNAPVGVIASYSMALLFVWAALSQRSLWILWRGIAGMALGFGLACFYIVPAAYEQLWVNIGQALSSGLLPSQNFLFTVIDDVEHTWFNWLASYCALLLILIFGLGALASRRFSRQADSRSKNPAALGSLLVVGAAATLLTLRFSSLLWEHLPKLRFIQFPWRWMSVIALISACFLAIVFQRPRGWVWFVGLLALLVPLGALLVTNTWWDEDEMPTLRDAFVNGRGFEGTDEYDPIGDDHLDLPLDAPLAKVLPADSTDAAIPQVRVQIPHWSTEQKEIHVDAQSEARIALRVLNYPAWQVELNGKPLKPERLDDVNQMVVPVAAGSSDIRVRFMRTFDRKLGNGLSTASALVALFLFWLGRRRQSSVA
jgi:hypothetical protein